MEIRAQRSSFSDFKLLLGVFKERLLDKSLKGAMVMMSVLAAVSSV
jgi:hypothetical protein